MMPDGLFSRPVPVLKADHYMPLCSFSAKVVAPKMSCHQHEEGMQHASAGHYSDPARMPLLWEAGQVCGAKPNTRFQGFSV